MHHGLHDDNERAQAALDATLTAMDEHRRARMFRPDREPEQVVLAAHLADPYDGHAWMVYPEEVTNPDALRSMHVAAHARLCTDYAAEYVRVYAEEFGTPYEVAPAIEQLPGHADPFDGIDLDALYAELTFCGHAVRFAGGWAVCRHGQGHYPHTLHGAPDPERPGWARRWANSTVSLRTVKEDR